MSEVKFPKAHAKLVGQDGNAFSIMGIVAKAMRRAGCTEADVTAYTEDAMSGDYNNLLQVSMRTVNVS